MRYIYIINEDHPLGIDCRQHGAWHEEGKATEYLKELVSKNSLFEKDNARIDFDEGVACAYYDDEMENYIFYRICKLPIFE